MRALFGLLIALALLAAACGPAGGATAPALPTLAAVATDASAVQVTATPAALTAALDPTQAPGHTPMATDARATARLDPASATPGPATADGACTETQGHFTAVDVPSAYLGYPIATRIYTPPCYASSDELYPVLYLIHGLNFNEDQWERLGIGSEADKLIASHDIAPLIIVLPRDRDDTRLDPAFVTDLLPYIDSHYRTLPSAGYRAIGGMSRGGGWAIHLGLRYANLFGRVAADSPAIFYGDELNVLNYIRMVAKNGTGPALYLDIGSGDPQSQSVQWLQQMFTAYRLPYDYVTAPGGHDEAYWTAHLDDYLRFYAAAWRPQSMLSPTPSPTVTRTPRPSATRTRAPARAPSATPTATRTPK
jgi:enterochelin esterase-like enzyme